MATGPVCTSVLTKPPEVANACLRHLRAMKTPVIGTLCSAPAAFVYVFFLHLAGHVYAASPRARASSGRLAAAVSGTAATLLVERRLPRDG